MATSKKSPASNGKKKRVPTGTQTKHQRSQPAVPKLAGDLLRELLAAREAHGDDVLLLVDTLGEQGRAVLRYSVDPRVWHRAAVGRWRSADIAELVDTGLVTLAGKTSMGWSLTSPVEPEGYDREAAAAAREREQRRVPFSDVPPLTRGVSGA